MTGWSLGPAEPGYPEQLAELEHAGPLQLAALDAGGGPVLHGVGSREAICGLAAGAAATIVGSRRATRYGLEVAERLAFDLASAGVTVVSGMAIGIDAAAHLGALTAGGPTIAVLAGGPDVVYPSRHRPLYRRIVASGAAISDQAPGVQPRKQSFPARNRIMAALSKVVVLVEAAHPSGSLITAERARELGREIAAVPGRVGVRAAEGTNGLIKDGAHLVRDAHDILDLLAGVGTERVARVGCALDEPLDRALEAVERGAETPDELARESGLDGAAAAIAVARLELLGYVASDGLGAYSRTGLQRPENRSE